MYTLFSFQVIWRKLPEESPVTIGENLFKQDSRISISHDTSRNNWDLIITDLKFEDSGVYECQVPSSNKNVRQHIFLRVKGIIILASFSSIYIVQENPQPKTTSRLTCKKRTYHTMCAWITRIRINKWCHMCYMIMNHLLK
jgi:hypothetical protein